ncbi:MAG TPA: hypothetical protein EYN44_20070 [Marinobacter salarius]|uniref:Uncharacterized protein n=1 Tax=Alloalcanivorax xenomutans TaxID=1094342 RepID=A0A9Q3W5U4_9GAMM|nr:MULTISPECIES: hypothetical protein [Gammaproteobacteria]MCE7508867.1 hypothetical protein [Alloalcanivorax xenomutans]HIP01876.1 hypothetical protein [Marinobacter salarius]
MDMKRYSISGKGKVTTYNWMIKSAGFALESARASSEGQFFNSMSVLIYSAFAMEAFFNHLGSHLSENWESEERKISKWQKFRDFNCQLNLSRDLDSRPYLSVFEAFNFRDYLAHGRTEEIKKEEVVEISEDEVQFYMIGSKWMETCTLEKAEEIFADIKSVITEMYKASGLGELPFSQYHSSAYGAT